MKQLLTLLAFGLIIAGCEPQQNKTAPSPAPISTPVAKPKSPLDNVTEPTPPAKTNTGLNRNPELISYSKHARCRMYCRHIDEREIEEILHKGKINYKKSQLDADDCHKRYAVEGTSNDKQQLRIIFVCCGNENIVITCIDLKNDWYCDCD